MEGLILVFFIVFLIVIGMAVKFEDSEKYQKKMMRSSRSLTGNKTKINQNLNWLVKNYLIEEEENEVNRYVKN